MGHVAGIAAFRSDASLSFVGFKTAIKPLLPLCVACFLIRILTKTSYQPSIIPIIWLGVFALIDQEIERYFSLIETLVQSDTCGLQDCQLIEAILSSVSSLDRANMLARLLFGEFGSLAGIQSASAEQLYRVSGIVESEVALLAACREYHIRSLRERLRCASYRDFQIELKAYVSSMVSFNPDEHIRVLFLDLNKRFIDDEVTSRGDSRHTPLYPREIVKRALELGAFGLIVVHNKPAGIPNNLVSVIEYARQLQDCIVSIEISLDDYLVVSGHTILSLRSEEQI